MTIYEALKQFCDTQGMPTLVVGGRAYKFPLQEALHGTEATLITLPDHVWEREKLYVEHVMANWVTFIDEAKS